MNAEAYERLSVIGLDIWVITLPVILGGRIRNNDRTVGWHTHPWRITWLRVRVQAY